mmetsp:Transcript_122231/g.260820  ORF Transcript_122231/g.260820 Transcript_122231/m.260820 type:complete len:209 (+) Transcript_122231:83-709(+)
MLDSRWHSGLNVSGRKTIVTSTSMEYAKQPISITKRKEPSTAQPPSQLNLPRGRQCTWSRHSSFLTEYSFSSPTSSPIFNVDMPNATPTAIAREPTTAMRDLIPVMPPSMRSHSEFEKMSRSIALLMDQPTSPTRVSTLKTMYTSIEGMTARSQTAAQLATVEITMILLLESRSAITPQKGKRNAFTRAFGDPVAASMVATRLMSFIT